MEQSLTEQQRITDIDETFRISQMTEDMGYSNTFNPNMKDGYPNWKKDSKRKGNATLNGSNLFF